MSFAFICVIETGHQLDWADQPVRYSRAEVSLFDRALCRRILGRGRIDLWCLSGVCFKFVF